tara:strand:- start:18 stop:467 length:450 start_codon:yes stop_codon:yes gene_type:complete
LFQEYKYIYLTKLKGITLSFAFFYITVLMFFCLIKKHLMIILTTSALAQQLKFIPREYSASSIVITDQDTNTPVTYTGLTFTTDRYYLQGNVIFSPILREGTFYTLEILNGTSVVYRDNIFCTDQTISTYSINDGVFTEHVTTNEYVVI